MVGDLQRLLLRQPELGHQIHHSQRPVYSTVARLSKTMLSYCLSRRVLVFSPVIAWATPGSRPSLPRWYSSTFRSPSRITSSSPLPVPLDAHEHVGQGVQLGDRFRRGRVDVTRLKVNASSGGGRGRGTGPPAARVEQVLVVVHRVDRAPVHLDPGRVEEDRVLLLAIGPASRGPITKS